MLVGRMRFNRIWSMLLLLVSSGSPESRTQRHRLSAGFGQPALDYHLPTSLSTKSGWRDSNPRSRAPKTTCTAVPSPLPYIPLHFQSERADFEPPVLLVPRTRYRRDNQASLRSALSSSCGSRTRLAALKGRDPQTDRRTSHRRRAPSTQLTHGLRGFSRSGSGGARIRVSRLFRPPLHHLSYRPKRKKPDVVVTPGFGYSSGTGTA